MKRRVVKLFSLFLVFFLVASIPFTSYARTESEDYTDEELDQMRDALDKQYEKNRYLREKEDYYIKDLDVNVTVSRNNVFHIKETYVYDFTRPHHGPTRTFILNHKRKYSFDELLNNPAYKNANNSTIIANVENLKVSSDDASSKIASSNKYQDYLKVNIGSKSKTYTGVHKYEFSYDYKIYSNDPIEGYDELYFNIIGTKNECPVDHATFTVKMPKKFDTKKIGFSVGNEYSTGYDENNLKFTVNKNTIKGEYLLPLYSGNGITIRTLLPEGYFSINHNPTKYYYLIFGIVIIGILVMIPWKGLAPKPVEVVNFYPPNNMSPVELEAIYRAGEPKRITSMIPYLANKGCFKIINDSKSSFSFEKLERDNSDLDKAGSLFMKGLFKNKNYVTKSDLQYKFYKTIDAIKAFYGRIGKDQIDKNSKIYLKVAIWLATAISLFVNFITTNGILYCPRTFDFTLILIPLILLFVYSLSSIILFIVSIFAYIIYFVIRYYSFIGCKEAIIISTIAYIGCFVMVKLAKLHIKRKEEENKLYGEILGFKRFIETAELDKLKALSTENPKYFYDILSYAYVFGLEKKWISNFDSIQDYIADQDWYAGSLYDIYVFNSFNHMLNSTYSNSLASTPAPEGGSSGGGSGFSGGGFSGGGSGGGGAGAW
ncbi:MAG: DUF2207 domain-containing protein [Lachnospiraceae bacterium]|nr:DUF2207 domain-containing protein [Lachnospiraceae bacterium]